MVSKCRACHTIKELMCKGLCKSCYLKAYRESPENKDRIAKAKAQWYQRQTKESRYLIRNREYFSGQRDKVLLRDNYTCQNCGGTKHLTVHHKDGKGRSVVKTDRNNSLRNLITLCRSCHINIHRHEIQKQKKTRANGFWSKTYTECTKCGRNDRPHNSNGLCQTCYAALRRQNSNDIV